MPGFASKLSQRAKASATLVALTLFLLLAQSQAFEPVLSARDVSRAVQAGSAMVSPTSGYRVQDYVLHEYIKDVRLRPSDPEVNAITLSTPFEALRYDAYVARYQRKSLSPAAVRKDTAETAHKLTVNVYAHSPFTVEQETEQFLQAYRGRKGLPSKAKGRGAHQRSFMDFYSEAELELGGHTFVAQKVIDGPYQDQFSPFHGTPEFRLLGVVHYTFDLSGTVTKGETGTLTFVDFSGHHYRDRIDFDRYR